MECAEQYAAPLEGELGAPFLRKNDFNEGFFLRWGRLRFEVYWGVEVNLKVVLKVYRSDGVCERFIVDTDPHDLEWNRHKRVTRDFFIHPFPAKLGRTMWVHFSYLVHVKERAISSLHDYLFMAGPQLDQAVPQRRSIPRKGVALNTHRFTEVDADTLQRDVDWCNRSFHSLRLVPKFTKGQPNHPYHPKRYIHDRINEVICAQRERPQTRHTIKVCVDCIDDTDFISHLLYANEHGVSVQCVVDWRKMTLTHSDNYARLKRSSVDLLGVFCTPIHSLIEVAPDMHNKFILFDDEHCIQGSFNITFDRWWANWESGMSFQSQGVCRLFDNIFQSTRGAVVRPYGIDPLSHFNLLYTFGRHALMNGKYYRPHHAILSEINRARRSLKLCLFLIGELRGEHQESVIDALIKAHQRGVEVQIILNGHMACQGDAGKERTMAEELQRPLLPAVARLRQARVPVLLAYGQHDQRVPYCPLHAKYCIIDDYIVLDGSYNWYNTSVFSHDQLIIAAHPEVARHYLYEFQQILRCFKFPR